jgi:septal ring factor EnvC (AmiA/AmiB activator)
MMRIWNLAKVNLLLVGVLAAGPAAWGAQEPANTNRDEVVKQLGELKTSIDTLTKSVIGLQSSSLSALGQIQKTQADIDALKRQMAQLQQEEIENLRRQVAQLQKDFDELNRRTNTPPRQSLYAPTPPASTARVRLVNSYSLPETVIVNGRAYPLQPGETRTTEPIPAGVFSYEVLGVQAVQNRTVGPNETFTITIHPQF